jgi:outer membrane protein assembly factor BamB
VAITLLLLATITGSTFFASSNYAFAHTPAWTIPIHVYTVASPNTLAINNPVTIFYWIDIASPTEGPKEGYLWQNITIDITQPDGTVSHFGPLTADYSTSGNLQYYALQTGTYNVTVNFPAQVLTKGTNLASTSVYINDTYEASTATTSFNVQGSVPNTAFQEPPLPISYWTRPIDANDQGWSVIGSNWLGQNLPGATYLKFQPFGWAPNTAHVLLTIPLNWGGIVGGGNTVNSAATYYEGDSKEKFTNPLILNGILYYSVPLANAGTGGGVTAVDLRTGQTLWTNTAINSVTFGQLYDFESSSEHGVETGYLWATGTAVGTGINNPGVIAVNALGSSYAPGTTDLAQVTAVTNNTQTVNAAGSWIAIDAQTGRLLFNETNAPSGAQAEGPNGEWLEYGIGSANATAPYTYLWQWNNTKLPGIDQVGSATSWSPGTTNWNMSTAYDWNVTLTQALYGTTNQFGTYTPTIVKVLPGDLIFGQSSGLQQTSTTSTGAFGTPDPFTLWAINLNSTRGAIGEVLWQKTFPAPQDNLTVELGPVDSETNVFTLYYRETMQWSGYDLLTGNNLWSPTAPENPLDYYGGVTSHIYPYAVAYGTLYSTGYSGTLYAYDLKTGNLKFTYGNDPNNPDNSTASSNAPFGNYQTQVAAVADNKVYLITGEYDFESPPYQGASTIALDASNGTQLWKVYGTSEWEEQAVADGYYVWFNQNEQQIYVTGPGPSATTVTASDAANTLGTVVEVTGTVTDQSPTLKGTPAISDADQGVWTDYIVEHTAAQPNVTGVPVQLTFKAPDGTVVQQTTVTSDSSGIFHFAWTAQNAGEYTVVANFAGTQSYGPSSAETALFINSASSTAAPIQNNVNFSLTYTALIIATAVIIGVATTIAIVLRAHKIKP